MGGSKNLFNELASNCLLGAYVFPCKDLKHKQFLFNDGIPTLIFLPNRKDTVLLNEAGKLQSYTAVWGCYGIIQNTYWEMPPSLDSILVLRFKPAAFHALFQVSAAALAKPIFDLAAIVDAGWQRIFDYSYELATWEARAMYLHEQLSLALIEPSNFPAAVDLATKYVAQRKGNCTVSDLLQQLGPAVNAKWLHRNFVKYIGMAPKKYICVQRFAYTYGQLNLSKSKDASAVLMFSGYYDYNHFLKHFKQYLGMAPSFYLWD